MGSGLPRRAVEIVQRDRRLKTRGVYAGMPDQIRALNQPQRPTTE